jgi:putative membrane protein
MNWDRILEQVVSAVVFGGIGVLLFLVAFRIMRGALPFSIAKEIAEDQNVALAIVVGAGMLGLALIVAVAVAG